jgi:hypothetical protein
MSSAILLNPLVSVEKRKKTPAAYKKGEFLEAHGLF